MTGIVWNLRMMSIEDFQKYCEQRTGENIRHENGNTYYIKKVSEVEYDVFGTLESGATYKKRRFFITLEQKLGGFGGWDSKHEISVPDGKTDLSVPLDRDGTLSKFITFK